MEGRVLPLKTSIFWVFFSLSLSGVALAQAPESGIPETVSWSIAPQAAKAGGKLLLTLRGTVQDGWHVYSLKQAPDGPTPLLVSLGASDVIAAEGAVTESRAVKQRDPAFGLDTQFYEHAFTLTVPVRLKPQVAGQQVVPVNVRFQTCNGRICQPPKTVHLSAPVNVQAGG
jgi:cytochrome c biogenesis DsbD-like protein